MKVRICGRKALVAVLAAALLLLSLVGAAVLRVASVSEEGTPVPILMYHSVGYNTHSSKYILTPEAFEEDLRWLSEQGFRTVFISELTDYVDGEGSLPDRPVVITLDDGYLNNLTYVLPLLEKYGMKATVSVVGSFCQTYTERPDPNPAYAYLTWEDVERMSRSGRIEIANHTYAMHSVEGRQGCMRRDNESVASYSATLMSDLNKLQAMLAHRTGVKPTVFAYPYGAVSAEAVYVLQALEFRAALTCNEKINFLSPGDRDALFHLGRFNRPSGEETGAFMTRVLGNVYS